MLYTPAHGCTSLKKNASATHRVYLLRRERLLLLLLLLLLQLLLLLLQPSRTAGPTEWMHPSQRRLPVKASSRTVQRAPCSQ
jgi:hypothetical protein